jgi:hypothetical protein
MLPAFRVPVSKAVKPEPATEEDLECSRCGAALNPDEVSYSGPEDRTADRNDPTQFTEVVCFKCDRAPAHYSFVEED